MKRPGPQRTVDVLPVLEQATWPHRDRVIHTPLCDHPESPIVAFAQGTTQGRAYVTADDALGVDPRALLDASTRSLAAAPYELTLLFHGVAGSVGELSAERIVDPAFRAAVHGLLGPEVWIAVPHRYAVFAVAVHADPAQRAAFGSAVGHELGRAAASGWPCLSPLAFRMVAGVITAAVLLDAIEAGAATGVAGFASSIPHPRELIRIDHAAHELTSSVLVVGSGAKQLARAILDLGALGAPASTEIDLAVEHGRIAIGRIQGWTPWFHVYAVEPNAIGAAVALATGVNAVIVAHDAPDGWPAPEVAAVARTAGAAGAVIAVVGPGRAAAALVGVALDVIAPYDRAAPGAVFKAVAKHVLQRLYGTTP
jgi:hypothetical protein